MPTLLDRYLQGEYERVWAELLAEGEAIQQEPLHTEAIAIATETFRRARHNIEILAGELPHLGYVFGVYYYGHKGIPSYSAPYHPPVQNVQSKIKKWERKKDIQYFPLSLKMFWTIVGDVDFMGYHPSWPPSCDPLVVHPIKIIDYEYEEWHYNIDEGDRELGDFRIPFAPDYYHKDNVSGGSPYEIRVPDLAIDGVVENEPHATTFVNYLRICFQYAGFSGFGWNGQPVPPEIPLLAEKLVPI